MQTETASEEAMEMTTEETEEMQTETVTEEAMEMTTEETE